MNLSQVPKKQIFFLHDDQFTDQSRDLSRYLNIANDIV